MGAPFGPGFLPWLTSPSPVCPWLGGVFSVKLAQDSHVSTTLRHTQGTRVLGKQ